MENEIENVESNPIVINCNTTEQKMKAIVNLSKAIYELSKQLGSVNTTVSIANCNISNAEVGIKMNS